MRRTPIALCAAAFALVGCQPPLTQSWQVTEFRVLGIKPTADSNPTLAEPSRGEGFSLSLATADPRGRMLQVVWFVTPFAISPTSLFASRGGDAGSSASQLNLILPLCLSNTPLPIPASQLQCGGGTTAHFTVPSTGGGPDTTGHESLTVIGYACAGGTIAPAPSGSATLFECRGTDARGWEFTRTISVNNGSEAVPNHNPVIREVSFGTEDSLAPIGDTPPVVARCLDQPVTTQARGTVTSCPRYHIRVAYTDASREMYPQTDPVTNMVTTVTEHLVTRYGIDHGTLSNSSVSDSDSDPMSNMGVTFIAPAEAGTVTLYVYSFDGRGGFDAATRTITVQ